MRIIVKTAQDGPGRHRAWCPDLPGCRAEGRSRREAVANIDRMVRGYLASLNRPAPGMDRKIVRTV